MYLGTLIYPGADYVDGTAATGHGSRAALGSAAERGADVPWVNLWAGGLARHSGLGRLAAAQQGQHSC
jgi:hypothetical protein